MGTYLLGSRLFSLTFVVVMVLLLPAPVRLVVNMYENEPEMEVLDKDNFNSVVYGSSKASFVEFYAHWCGACKRYKSLIIEVAKSTKTWHANVMRVAAINCGDSYNEEVCRKHSINRYPTLRVFGAFAQEDESDAYRGAIELSLDTAENLVRKMIEFVEKHQSDYVKKNKDDNKALAALHWPDFAPFTSKRADTLFISNKETKFAILIIEKDDSYLGRKLILDFSTYSDRVIIRRSTPTANPSLIVKLDVDTRKLPLVYVVNNTRSSDVPVNTLPAELLNDALVKRYKQALSGADFDDAEAAANEDDLVDVFDPHDQARVKMSHLVSTFIKTNSLLTHDEAQKIQEHVNAVHEHREKVKKEEAQAVLANIEDKVYMQDLESGLHLMLRSDVSHIKLISGKKLTALREWIGILNNYFPGRKPVRNYLKNLNAKLNSSQLTEITGNQWKMIADEKTASAYLPNVTDWKHCLGSKPEYRGYPCALWTIFHVLTVNQVDLEKSKKRPFVENFNVKEVIEGIRTFVTNFFTCHECAENFERETQDYLRHLSKPHDAITYIWKIHNKVNRRLANDQITETDPEFPKKQFPTLKQCPNCYLPSLKDVDELSDHESPWNTRECLTFLTTYYARYQIVPIDESSSQNQHQLKPPHKLQQQKEQNDTEGGNEEILPLRQVDEPKVPDAVVDRMPLRHLELDKQADVAAEAIETSSQKSSDFKLSIMLIFVAFTSFAVLYIYFNYFRRMGNKAKKHII